MDVFHLQLDCGLWDAVHLDRRPARAQTLGVRGHPQAKRYLLGVIHVRGEAK